MRKHAGMIVPWPVQAAMVAALGDDAHVAEQQARYAARRATLLRPPSSARVPGRRVRGGALPLGDPRARTRWASVAWLAERGVLVAPGHFYGAAGAQHVRVALTATDERVAAAADALVTRSGTPGRGVRPPLRERRASRTGRARASSVRCDRLAGRGPSSTAPRGSHR